MNQLFYSALNNDGAIAKKSSSGGAFSAITDTFFELNQNAVVYGCALNDKLEAVHIRADRTDERNLMRGSKYIQSSVSGIYKSIENDLKNNANVCFSGTPCQIVGLLSYLKQRNISLQNLLTIEVICHGVGSSKFFEDYIDCLEKKYKSKAVSCNFRGKSRPGKKQDMEIIFENGKKYNASSSRYDWFYSIYLKNLILRPSCYKCRYACEERNADLSIADLWGKLNNDLIPKSLIIVNSKKGKFWLDNSQKYMEVVSIDKEDIHQPHMHAPAKKPDDYDNFWDIYINKGYMAVQKVYGNNTLKGKLKNCTVMVSNKLNLTVFLKKLYRGIVKE